MQIQKNILLAPYTTFKIGGPAKFFCVVENQFDALEAYEFAKEKNLKTFVLGGGSNILVSDSGFNGLVIKVANKGIEVVKETETEVLLKVCSAESWDGTVEFCVKNSWWGLENLSHIPGSTGAIAVQNVGAYGQEASQVIDSVTVFNKDTHQILQLSNKDCGFGYRASIFNSIQKGKYIIFDIYFKLTKDGKPNLSYRDLVLKFKGQNPTIDEVRKEIISIRDKKFPFPKEAKKGNAGSFFKNVVLDKEGYEKLKQAIGANFGIKKVEELEAKKFEENFNLKIPAAFLLELCELKGLKVGGAAINENQPLVIVNESGLATAEDVLHLANQIKNKIADKTGVSLQFEPELIGFE